VVANSVSSSVVVSSGLATTDANAAMPTTNESTVHQPYSLTNIDATLLLDAPRHDELVDLIVRGLHSDELAKKILPNLNDRSHAYHAYGNLQDDFFLSDDFIYAHFTDALLHMLCIHHGDPPDVHCVACSLEQLLRNYRLFGTRHYAKQYTASCDICAHFESPPSHNSGMLQNHVVHHQRLRCTTLSHRMSPHARPPDPPTSFAGAHALKRGDTVRNSLQPLLNHATSSVHAANIH
jgi:hypothetical protein